MTIELKLPQDKKLQIGITILICFGIILSGTFAWYSFSQNVLNEFLGQMPRVNLHDDFKEPNKDVYVENTSGDPVIVRVKLLEFMLYGPDDVGGFTSVPSSGSKNATNDINLATDPSSIHTWDKHDGAAGDCNSRSCGKYRTKCAQQLS